MKKFLNAIVVIVALTAFSAVALAQEAAPAPAAAPAAAKEEKKDDGHGRMGSFSIAPRIGWAYYMANAGIGLGKGISVNSAMSHPGMNLQVNIDFGAPSKVFEFAPYYTYHATTGGASHSAGVYMGYAYRFELLGGKLYPSIGGGTKLGFYKTPGSDWGLETTARIPVSVTYYVTEDIGLLFEVSFGVAFLTSSGKSTLTALYGFYTDGGFGIRWP